MGNIISYQITNCHAELPDKGIIRGLRFDDKSCRFAGIPYALPPTGNLRWRKPQPLPQSHSYSEDGQPFDATQFGPVCHQPNYSASVKKTIPHHTYGEDCLRLNIWTPVKVAGQVNPKWPVMIWFHGGWFQIGDPSQEKAMDPTELISTGGLNAVFVAVGYRLNIFGFLAGSELRDESNGNEVGNYGLWDQRLAMEWVYENISAFGGDPKNITLAGRSAGAYAVQAQTLYDFRGNAASKDFFRRLVMYSNAIPTQPKSPEDCQVQFDELCGYFSISSASSGQEKLQRLREVSAEDLTAAIMKLKHHTFRPVTDGVFIHPGIFEYYRDGSFAEEFKKRGLRIYIGEVANEETLYAVTNGPEANIESLQLQVTNYYPPSTTDRLLQSYAFPKSENKNDWEAVFGRIVSDGQVRAPSRFLVDNLVQHGVDIHDVWRYFIAYRLSFITDKVAPPSFGVSHAMDRPFWNYSIMHGPTAEERQLMGDWIQDLVEFVGGNEEHQFGTQSVDEYKVLTPRGTIEIEKDTRWDELLRLMDVFSGSS
ncbi:hypothetical protein ASPWEDRAFT_136873 [Aspergillus wentii DTO 134E9]|uniref:Carboxylic ester hydrolase n=1 Tax=Aspergillus wentii DTO 134E9 TaxID=1073089 RepID=A0A1L9RCD7_ASPWE|nr:uncharacterized protein ASPWEDRAFT_136873 [Aspergillus wentii DTO 134E9]KAI9924183.1 hypothetical protein MW887_007133 [Aspergillus wentii]OJJ32599.1 hypothetical protein ASPWEDRAFT_136873 [Aspergillus wentii DTO 134E9]